jgi:cytochrome b561
MHIRALAVRGGATDHRHPHRVSEGAPLAIPLTSWQLPPCLQLGNGWEERLEDLHETVGNVFYGVIGLHVAAAFWHHYVRRDRVLRQML